jgi:hypothetical protein
MTTWYTVWYFFLFVFSAAIGLLLGLWTESEAPTLGRLHFGALALALPMLIIAGVQLAVLWFRMHYAIVISFCVLQFLLGAVAARLTNF